MIAARNEQARYTLRAFCAAAATATLLLLAAPAAADDEPTAGRLDGDADVIKQAEALFEKAKVAYRIGDFTAALEDYKAALKLLERPSLIFNIAQCHFHLKQWQEALFHYRHYLAVWAKQHPDEPAPNLAGVHEQIAKIELILEQQKTESRKQAPIVVKPSTTVVIKGDKEATHSTKEARLRIGGLTVVGARVFVDGELKAVAPIAHALPVRPGVRRVTIEAAGYLPWRQEVNAVLATETLVPVDLVPLPRRNKAWLALAISSLAMAAGAEAMAVGYYFKANERIAGTKAFEQDKRMVLLGHGLAGGLAALSALPLYLYVTSNQVKPIRGGQVASPLSSSFVPLPGGGMVAGRVHF